VIIRQVSHVEIADDQTTVRLHHPDGYITGIILEPEQPFPAAETTCVIEPGRVTYQAADGKSHAALQHAPALDSFKKAGAALAVLLYSRLNARSLGRRFLSSPIVHERLKALQLKGVDVTQSHVQEWWETAKQRHASKVESTD